MYANDQLMHIVWNGIEQAIYAYNSGKSLPESQHVRKAIDTSDVNLAKQIIEAFDIKVTLD